MGRSHFLKSLLVLAFLVLSFSHGSSRKVMETVEVGDSSVEPEEIVGKAREIIETADYEDPGPNTNPKTGPIPPPQL
ncbi:hypothetical protein JCGZ_19860 [Jatropha curcas]|uniref:Uncharacterized protein n=1 Tax=Jatropha curcas TaxID=180498 RepID=A0A067JT72_JATCU|nr:hypothetical protein JCGZ_19860 [Jatropha curcas]